MKTKLNLSILLALLLTSAIVGVKANAEMYSQKFTDLQIKNYDEMLKFVDQKIAEAKAAAIKGQEEGVEQDGDKQAVESLREALQVVMSRPDKDNMVAKLFPALKKELSNYGAFEETVASVAFQAMHAIQNETLSLTQRSTAVFIVENTLSEIKPLIADNDKLRAIVKKIRDVKLEISDKIKAHRKMISMDSTPDLSKIAGILYEAAEKQNAGKKKPAPQKETSQEDE